MSEYKPVIFKPNIPRLPFEMMLLRDFEMVEIYHEAYPNIPYERLGRLCIAQFRGTKEKPNAPDNDYMGIGRQIGERFEWQLIFEQYELMTYLGGIALSKERQNMLHGMTRANRFKSAMDKFGWQAQVVIDDEPSVIEEEAYGDWLIGKYPDLHQDLNAALGSEFND